MFVKDWMTPNPVTTSPDTSVPEALRLMREKKIRRLPVVDGRGELVGIVSEKDLLYASPSPATSLNIWEIYELLGKVKVHSVMSRKVITVSADTPVEEAARIMADNKIGGLPVVDGKKLVGIITETDLFKVFLELLGGRRQGVRVTISTSGAKGTMARITRAIFEAGGDIIGLGVSEVPGSAGAEWKITCKVQDVPREKLVEAIRSVAPEILDVREM